MHRLWEREMNLFEVTKRDSARDTDLWPLPQWDLQDHGRLQDSGKVTTVVLHQGQPAVPNQTWEIRFWSLDHSWGAYYGRWKFLGSSLHKSRDKITTPQEWLRPGGCEEHTPKELRSRGLLPAISTDTCLGFISVGLRTSSLLLSTEGSGFYPTDQQTAFVNPWEAPGTWALLEARFLLSWEKRAVLSPGG